MVKYKNYHDVWANANCQVLLRLFKKYLICFLSTNNKFHIFYNNVTNIINFITVKITYCD